MKLTICIIYWKSRKHAFISSCHSLLEQPSPSSEWWAKSRKTRKVEFTVPDLGPREIQSSCWDGSTFHHNFFLTIWNISPPLWTAWSEDFLMKSTNSSIPIIPLQSCVAPVLLVRAAGSFPCKARYYIEITLDHISSPLQSPLLRAGSLITSQWTIVKI